MWQEPYIEALAASGVTRGCNPPANDRFCPDATVTRGQVASFLVRALNLPAAAEPDQFTDDDESPHAGDIDALVAAGVTKGCDPPDNTQFCPDRPVTRGEMAAFLVRAFGYESPADTDTFTDDDTSIFEAAIEALRSCASRPALRERIASRGRQRVLEVLDPNRIGRLMRQRLVRLQSRPAGAG